MKKCYLDLLKRILAAAVSVSMILQPIVPAMAAEDTESVILDGASEEALDADTLFADAESLDDETAQVLAQTEDTITDNGDGSEFEDVLTETEESVSGVEEDIEEEEDVVVEDDTEFISEADVTVSGDEAPELERKINVLDIDELILADKMAERDDNEFMGKVFYEDENFTVYAHDTSNTKVKMDDTGAIIFPDNSKRYYYLNLNGGIAWPSGMDHSAKSIAFETTQDNVVVKIWWKGNGMCDSKQVTETGGREWAIFRNDEEHEKIAETKDNINVDGKTVLISTLTVPKAGKYLLGGYGGSNFLYRLEIREPIPTVPHEVDVTELVKESKLEVKDYDLGGAEIYKDDYLSVYSNASGKTTIGQKLDDQGEASTVKFSDGTRCAQYMNMNGTMDISGAKPSNAIKFTTTNKNSMVKIWWKGAGAGAEWAVYTADDKHTEIGRTSDNKKEDGTSRCYSRITVKDPGTYFVGPVGAPSLMYKMGVYEGGNNSVVDWDNVGAPVVKSVSLNGADKQRIAVTVAGDVDEERKASKIMVYMIPSGMSVEEAAESWGDNAVDTKIVMLEEGTVEFEPTYSDTYKFVAVATREDFPDKVSAASEPVVFRFRIGEPRVASVANTGAKSVKVDWGPISEADYYVASIEGTGIASEHTTRTTATLDTSKLTYGKTYKAIVTAYRDKDNWKEEWGSFDTEYSKDIDEAVSEPLEFELRDKFETAWTWTCFGESTVTNSNKLDYFYDKNGEVIGRGCQTADSGSSTGGQDGYIEERDENGDLKSVRVYAVQNGGKIVPLSQDGLSMYYVRLPADQNFTISAKAHVNNWSYSNGQEGFGVIAADRVGVPGDKVFWNNSVMSVITKSEYRWDRSDEVNDFGDLGNLDLDRYNMYLGISSLVRYGVTKDNLKLFINKPAVAQERYFYQNQKSLEHIYSDKKGGGNFNLVGNYQAGVHNFTFGLTTPQDYLEKGTTKEYKTGNKIVNPDTGKKEDEKSTKVQEGKLSNSDLSDHSRDMVDFVLTVQKNNNGYDVSYTSPDGKVTTNSYPDSRYFDEMNMPVDLKTALSKKGILETIDEDYIYAGFFAARNADVTFSDIKLVTVDPYKDTPTQPAKPVVKDNTSDFISATTSNTNDYTLTYYPAWKGKLTITNGSGMVLFNSETDERYKSKGGQVDAKYYINIPVTLSYGANSYYASFTPDKDYHLDFDPTNPATAANYNNVLKSYDTVTSSITVNLRSYGEEGTYLYVSPEGRSTGNGTLASPLDIYTAVKYVKPGQQIVVSDGEYRLSKPVQIARGISGTKDKPIKLVADPEAKSRPVFNFLGSSAGFSLAGDWWTIKGIEITNTSDKQKGLSVAGSYNVVEDVVAHHCGNNGIEISRLKSTDTHAALGTSAEDGQPALWPHDNYIHNCTSYENSDAGYEDADGFACKLTIGPGNVFDGCLAYFNADDGWDLYSKSEDGEIGRVIIKNCVTYGNGYLHRDFDGDGVAELVGAGNGNGFKLGGESLPGGHTLINCFSFFNKSKGIDSNSCCDIKAYNCVSYNNESYNLAFYTKNNKGTDYSARNLISFRDNETLGEKTDQVYLFKDEYRDGLKNYKEFMNKSVFTTDLDMYYMKDGASASSKLQDLDKEDRHKKSISWKGDPENDFDEFMTEYPEARVSSDFNVFKAEYFKSLDFDLHNATITHETRNPDGTINMGDFLQLTDEAYKKLGLTGKIAINGTLPADMPKDPYLEKVGAVAVANSKINSDDLVESSGTKEIGTNDADSSGTSSNPDLDYIESFSDGRVTVGHITDQYFTGKAITPELEVVDGLGDAKQTLVRNKDYFVSYLNNVRAGTANVTVTGKGNYAGKYLYAGGEDVTFQILPISLREDFRLRRLNKQTGYYETVSVIDMDSVMSDAADGKPHKPIPTIMYDNGTGFKKLTAADFTVTYYNAKGEKLDAMSEAGIYTIAVEGKNKLEQEKDRKDPETGEIDHESGTNTGGNFSGIRNITYNLFDASSVKDIKPLKLTKKMLPQNLDASNGNQPFNLTTKGRYVEKADQMDKDEQLMYPITVDGTELKLGIDYQVSYSNNKKKGKGIATIVGLGTYGGKSIKKFSIKPAKLKVKGGAITVSYNEAELAALEFPYTGSPITVNNLIKVYYVGNDNAGIQQNKKLKLGRDFRIDYKRHRYAGQAAATVKGIGAYVGKFSFKYKIAPLTEHDVLDRLGKEIIIKTEAEKDQYGYYRGYRRDDGKVDVTITYNGNILKEGKDYKLNFINTNTVVKADELAGASDAKYAKYQVLFVSAMAGRITNDVYNEHAKANGLSENEMRYTIREGALSRATAYIDAQDIIWKGDKTKVATKFDVYEYATGRKLKAGQDYDRAPTFTYADGTPVEGTLKDPAEEGYDLTITVKGQGRYSGEVSDTIHVGKYDLAKTGLAKTISKSWDSYNKKNQTGIELSNSDMKGLLKDGKDTLTYLKDFKIAVTYDTTTHLKTARRYIDNDKVGNAKVIVTGLGKYAGTRMVYYTIRPKEMYSAGGASTGDTLSPITTANNIGKLGLDLTNAYVKGNAEGRKNVMTLIKGSKLNTTAAVKAVTITAGDGEVMTAKTNSKGIATLSAIGDGKAVVEIEMDDADIPNGVDESQAAEYKGTIYEITFNVETPAPQENAGTIALDASGKVVTKTIKDLFGTTVNGGSLTVLKSNVAGQANVEGEKLAGSDVMVPVLKVSPSKENTMVVQYTYLNAKYQITINVQ